VGQNYRLPELLGAVGLAAVENLPVMIERKRRIHGWYKQYMDSEDSNLEKQPENNAPRPLRLAMEEEGTDDSSGGGGVESESPDKPAPTVHAVALEFTVSEVLDFQKTRPGDEPVWWLNSLRLARHRLPNDLQQALKKKYEENPAFNIAEAVGMLLMKRNPHIEIRPAFFPLHKMSPFAKAARPCPNCDLVYQTLLCVPSSALLEESDVREVCSALRLSIRDALLQQMV